MTVRTWKDTAIVNTTLAGNQFDPDVVALPDGGYVVVWEDQFQIKGRFFNADGTSRTGEVVMGSHADPPANPDVAVHADGTVMLTYNIVFNTAP